MNLEVEIKADTVSGKWNPSYFCSCCRSIQIGREKNRKSCMISWY